MHIEMYLPEVVPQARLKIYRKTQDGWDEGAWYAGTLEDTAREAELDVGQMNDAYARLLALGVPEVHMTSYTADGNDTNDPAAAKLWVARWRHPQNSGMSSSAKGTTAGEALDNAAEMESQRQRNQLIASAQYHEREAARLRRILNGGSDE